MHLTLGLVYPVYRHLDDLIIIKICLVEQFYIMRPTLALHIAKQHFCRSGRV